MKQHQTSVGDTVRYGGSVATVQRFCDPDKHGGKQSIEVTVFEAHGHHKKGDTVIWDLATVLNSRAL
jgi:hypothetical protein